MSNAPDPTRDATPPLTPGHPTGEERVVGDSFPQGRTPPPAPPGEDRTIMSAEEAMSIMDDDDEG